jgi:hypothetical protein
VELPAAVMHLCLVLLHSHYWRNECELTRVPCVQAMQHAALASACLACCVAVGGWHVLQQQCPHLMPVPGAALGGVDAYRPLWPYPGGSGVQLLDGMYQPAPEAPLLHCLDSD